ncbi:MAG: hypothetical protein E6Z55_04775 [Peptoniphilus harei]|nr:hypothetical protein [Peptoniphilus harei]
MEKIVLFSNRRTSPKIALFERSEFAILEVRDLENINFCNEIFEQDAFFVLTRLIEAISPLYFSFFLNKLKKTATFLWLPLVMLFLYLLNPTPLKKLPTRSFFLQSLDKIFHQLMLR